MIFLFSFFALIHCSKESKDVASEFALTEEDKAAALQVHNNARTDVGVPPLTWSEALANDAARPWHTLHPIEANSFDIDVSSQDILPHKNLDAQWIDMNNDNIKDLVVVGEWMSP